MQDMTRTLRYLFILLFASIAGSVYGQGQSGSITGTVVDENKEPVIGAIVEVSQGGIVKGGMPTDVDGNYTIKPLSPGKYDVKVSYSSYKTSLTTGVLVQPDKTTGHNVGLELNPSKLDEVVITSYKIPLIDKYEAGGSKSMTSEEIEKLPTRNTNSMVSTAPGVYQQTENSTLQLTGARGEGTLYIIDGVQVLNGRGVNLTQGSIDQMQVLTSGLPAKYGDALGGVVNITTKGISDVYRGNVMLERSIDGYNHNLANFNLSGPLLSKKTENGKKPIIGFFVGGEVYYDDDRRPLYGGQYVLKEEKRKEIEQTPLRQVPTQTGVPSFRVASEYLRMEDFEISKKRVNANEQEARLNGRLDFQLSDNLNISAGANGTYRKSTAWSRQWATLNPETLPIDHNFTGRGYVRLTQRFGKSGVTAPVEGEAPKTPLISNAFYTLQVDYQRDFVRREHEDHKRSIFDYGYIGKYNITEVPVYGASLDDSTGRVGIRLLTEQLPSTITFERSEKNPILANYTSQYFNATNFGSIVGPTQTLQNIQGQGGLLNGQMPNFTFSPSPQLVSVGYGLTGYSFSTLDQVAISADASFDFQPGKTKHSIEFGLYYQQRVNRYFNATGASTLGGANLWQYMRQLTNSHISLSGEPIFIVNGKRYTRQDVNNGVISPSPYDTIVYDRVANAATQSTFDKNLRAKLGAGATDYINVDGLDPSTFSLDMFSADELLGNGQQVVGYAGFDYTGAKQKGQVNFNDFFTKKDANGNYTRDIGALRPNYIAGYVLDKFQFKDILFNVGVRIDRFDANTKTLKDPYSLYEVRDVASAKNSNLLYEGDAGVPSNIGDDYVVYVNNNEASTPKVIGYRNGDDWYDFSGRRIEDPTVLRNYSGGRDPQPLLVNSNVRMQDSSFNPNSSFTDYKPQVNVMPRLSFSFPVSDVALFYAHYDVIVQRPDNIFATPADYFFLQSRANQIIDNPGLKPQKMFDYEVGFKQQLSQRSAINISGFYKERKDMVQVRPYLFAWPQTYYTFGNRDFSTVKGMTLRYDLRRTGNIRMDIAYTLQFADGTGSSSSSANGGNSNFVSNGSLLSQFIQAQVPNLRYATALNIDSRHMVVATLDYRYLENEGPVVGGKHIFQNTGANLIFRGRSGEPYTRHQDAYQSIIQGELNGARLPWHYNLDLRVDKDFKLDFGKKKEGEAAKRPLYLNAFVYVQNLLNRRDVLSVDPFTGRPDDDAVLSSAQGIQDTQKQVDPQSFIDLYYLYQQNPLNLNLPRRINIGLQLNF